MYEGVSYCTELHETAQNCMGSHEIARNYWVEKEKPRELGVAIKIPLKNHSPTFFFNFMKALTELRSV